MISLKRFLESRSEDLLPAVVDNYRAAIAAFARSGAQIHPHLGESFEQSLLRLKEQVSASSTAAELAETELKVEAEIDQWSRAATDYLTQTTMEVRDIVNTVAASVQSLAERDQRYASRFGGIGKQLQEVAALDNLQQMRHSLSESIRSVNASVEQMVHEGAQSVASLQAQITSYQSRLEESERLAARDPLTGLDNRRSVERHLDMLSAQSRAFSVILIDLNGFKPINDKYGHQAGDSILQQFAREIQPLFRPTDCVGRWGGDEFIVVAACDEREIAACIGRVRQWAFGDYTIESGGQKVKVHVEGAIGIATWQAGETAAALIGRADAAMYRDKAARRE
ncbi:MAG: GGDEF domain-containing protein [Acidobacteriota bacterium]